MSLLLGLYRGGTRLLARPLARHDDRRLTEQGVDAAARRRERLGYATHPRPEGRVIWVNAVSVGELQSALGLIEALLRADPDSHIVVTTTTATAARMAATRLPKGALHQFAPLDTPGAVARFLDHWEPDLGILVESDLWPRQLRAARRRGVPLALVNARLSPKSLRLWGLFPRSAREVLGAFDLILCQTGATRDALAALAGDGPRIRQSEDLKSCARPLPIDKEQQGALARSTAGRPVWAAVSTHPGEDAPLLAAHARLLHTHPNALLILAPRHPERGAELSTLCQAQGLTGVQRSAGALPTGTDQAYIADTLGELGLWYDRADVAFVAGSIVDHGGHNPYEAAPFGTPVLTGPHIANARAAYDLMQSTGAAAVVTPATPEGIATALIGALGPEGGAMRAAMQALPRGAPDLPDRLARELLALRQEDPV